MDDPSATQGELVASSTASPNFPAISRAAGAHLRELSASYDPNHHSVYVDALIQGIERGKATNIALSGPYGSGKSSILAAVKARYPKQSLQVSLSTIRTGESPEATGGDSMSDVLDMDADQSGRNRNFAAVSHTSTDDLQREIVKQLLYVVDANSLPESPFRRLGRFSWGRASLWALVLGLTTVAIQWLSSIIVAFPGELSDLEFQPTLYVPTFLATVVLAVTINRLAHGRWVLTKLGAGGANVETTDSGSNYFDKHLEDIVYFFRQTRRRLVIFEDMDRYRNVEVFEDLRDLNTLLNHASQLKSRVQGPLTETLYRHLRLLNPFLRLGDRTEPKITGPIVFVYAVRDSLFMEKIAPEEGSESDPFPRTKFFDLIVPVVPFVTPKNARAVMRTTLNELLLEKDDRAVQSSERPFAEILRATAHYFPDQRQVINIWNEYRVYSAQLFDHHSCPEELTPDLLLALVLYKNAEVADFEKIRLGSSNLDKVRRFSELLVETALEEIQSELSGDIEARLINESAILGERLLEKSAPIGGLWNAKMQQLNIPDLSDVALLSRVKDGDLLYTRHQEALNRGDLETMFDVDFSYLETGTKGIGDSRRQVLLGDLRTLQETTWEKLWHLTRYKSVDPNVAGEAKQGRTQFTFREFVLHLLGPGIGSDLISLGLISQNFATLVAPFDESEISISANDFLTRTLESSDRRSMAPLSQADFLMVLNEIGSVIMNRAGMVNVDVIGHIARLGMTELVPDLAAQLINWTQEDQLVLSQFFRKYGGSLEIEVLRTLVRALSPFLGQIALFIIRDESVPADRRPQLFDAFLSASQNAEPPTEDSDIRAVADFAESNFNQLEVLRGETESAGSAAEWLSKCEMTFMDVESMSQSACRQVIEFNAFNMTGKNIISLAEKAGIKQPSLEKISEAYPELFDALFDRAWEFAREVIEPDDLGKPYFRSPEALLESITLFNSFADREMAVPLMSNLIHGSHPSSTVMRGEDLPAELQDLLFDGERLSPTYSNLASRLDEESVVPAIIVDVLSHIEGVFAGPDKAPNDLKFVNKIIRSTGSWPEDLTPAIVKNILLAVCDVGDQVDESSAMSASPAVLELLLDQYWVQAPALLPCIDADTPWKNLHLVLRRLVPNDLESLEGIIDDNRLPRFLFDKEIDLQIRATAIGDARFTDSENASENVKRLSAFVVRETLQIEFPDLLQFMRRASDASALIPILLLQEDRASMLQNVKEVLTALGPPFDMIPNRPSQLVRVKATPENKQFLEIIRQETRLISRVAPNKRLDALTIVFPK